MNFPVIQYRRGDVVIVRFPFAEGRQSGLLGGFRKNNFPYGMSNRTDVASSLSRDVVSNARTCILAGPPRSLLDCFTPSGVADIHFRLFFFGGLAIPGRRVAAAPQRSALGYFVIAPSGREDQWRVA